MDMDPRALAGDALARDGARDRMRAYQAYQAYEEAIDQLRRAYGRFEHLTLRFAGAFQSTPAQQRALEEALYDGASALQRVQETLARTPGASLTLRSLAQRPAARSQARSGRGDLAFDAAG